MDDPAPPPVAQTVLEDLRRRLRAHRRVELTGGTGWERGTEPGHLAGLIGSSAEDYDWRPHEARIRALPWSRTSRLRAGSTAQPAATSPPGSDPRSSPASSALRSRWADVGRATGERGPGRCTP